MLFGLRFNSTQNSFVFMNKNVKLYCTHEIRKVNLYSDVFFCAVSCFKLSANIYFSSFALQLLSSILYSCSPISLQLLPNFLTAAPQFPYSCSPISLQLLPNFLTAAPQFPYSCSPISLQLLPNFLTAAPQFPYSCSPIFLTAAPQYSLLWLNLGEFGMCLCRQIKLKV